MAVRYFKPIVFLLGLVPMARLVWLGVHENLGGNPIEYITHQTGLWTLILLVVTLAITPARRLLHVPQLIRFRRMIGLFAFFYAFLHFVTYIWLDKFFDLSDMLKDVQKRRFITVGFTAFLLLIPLAVTSTKGWIRRLGGKRWQALHRLVYVAAACGVIHFYWLVKSDIRLPALFGALVGVLLVYRLGVWLAARRKAPAHGRPALVTAETAPSSEY